MNKQMTENGNIQPLLGTKKILQLQYLQLIIL